MVAVSMPGPKPQKKRAMLPPSTVLQENFDSRENLEDAWDISTTRRRIPGIDDDISGLPNATAATPEEVAEEESLVAQRQNQLNFAAVRTQQHPLLSRPADGVNLSTPGTSIRTNRFFQNTRENLEDTWDISTTRRRIPRGEDEEMAEEESVVAQRKDELNAAAVRAQQQQPLLNRPAEQVNLTAPGTSQTNRFSQDTIAAIELYFKMNVTPPTFVDIDVEQRTSNKNRLPNSQPEKSGRCQCNCTVNVIFLLILVPISGGVFYLATRQNCEPGWIYSAETNWCYKVVEPSTFVAADATCRRMGAHLTSVHSCRENRKVGYLVRLNIHTKRPNRGEQFGLMWTGLSTDSDNGWSWSDGTTYDFTNWHENERRNVTNYQQCASVYVDYYGETDCRKTDWFCDYFLYKWTAVSCSMHKRPSVCQKTPLHWNPLFKYC